MKKIKIFGMAVAITLTLVLVFSFTACTPSLEPQDPVEGLSSEKVDEIRIAYIQRREDSGVHYKRGRDSIVVESYYGTYDGLVILFLYPSYAGYYHLMVVKECIVDGIYIGSYTDPGTYIAYFDPDIVDDKTLAGTFIFLDDAYNDGYLTHDDLISISQKVSGQNA